MYQPHPETDFALIYSYWRDGRHEAWKDLEFPVALAIASARKHHQKLPIYVLDTSAEVQDWGPMEEILNVKVVHRRAAQLPLTTNEQAGRAAGTSARNAGRVFDVYAFAQIIPERYVIFSDSDIFWLKPILPLNHFDQIECFCGNGNSGLYYFDKTSTKARHFFHLWRAILLFGCYDQHLKEDVVKFNAHGCFADESALRYIQQYPDPSLHMIDNLENFVLNDHTLNHFQKTTGVKAIHLMFGKWGKERGLACKRFKEIKENLALSEAQLNAIIPNPCDSISLYSCKSLEVEMQLGAKSLTFL